MRGFLLKQAPDANLTGFPSASGQPAILRHQVPTGMALTQETAVDRSILVTSQEVGAAQRLYEWVKRSGPTGIAGVVNPSLLLDSPTPTRSASLAQPAVLVVAAQGPGLPDSNRSLAFVLQRAGWWTSRLGEGRRASD